MDVRGPTSHIPIGRGAGDTNPNARGRGIVRGEEGDACEAARADLSRVACGDASRAGAEAAPRYWTVITRSTSSP